MQPRHLLRARHFQAAHFAYFQEETLNLGGATRAKRVTWVQRMGLYRAELEAHAPQDEDAILVALVLSIAQLEML